MTHHNTHTSNTTFEPTKSGVGLKLFLSFFWRNPRLMTIALVTLFINSFLTLLPAILIGRSLEVLLEKGYGPEFIKLSSLIIIIAVVTYFTTMLSGYSFSITAFALERDVRQEFFNNIVDSSLTFHDQNNSSNLLSLGLNEVHFMSGGAMMLRIIFQSVFSVILVLFYFNGIFELYVSVGIAFGFIFYFLFAFRYASKVVPIRKERSISLSALTEESQEIFRGIQVVKSFSSERREIKRFHATSLTNAKLSEKEGQLRAFYFPGLILILVTVSVFAYSMTLIQQGLMEVPQLVEVLGLLLTLQLVNLQIPTIILSVRGAIINADRISEKIESAKLLKSVSKETTGLQNQMIKEIKFDDVTFAYPATFKAVVKRLNFTIKSGEKIVLLGGPGSGKSSLLKLMLGLYTPQHGHILINGVDIRTLSEFDIRKNIAMVEQDVFLFSGTIRDNVAFANQNATDKDIMAAIKMAQASEFVDNLEFGLDTIIGERGVTISGGQKQRLAIARALLANPQLLLLDDSTSAVDSKTEALISKAIENLSINRTTISVAQRLNVLVNADKIIFLERGSIIGIGSHEELYKTNEKYQMIFDLLPDSKWTSKRSNAGMMVQPNSLIEGGVE